MVKRALFTIATHSNHDELTAAERKFAAAFANTYQASLESNNQAEHQHAYKELARHRRWSFFKKVFNNVKKVVKKTVKKAGSLVKKAAKKTKK